MQGITMISPSYSQQPIYLPPLTTPPADHVAEIEQKHDLDAPAILGERALSLEEISRRNHLLSQEQSVAPKMVWKKNPLYSEFSPEALHEIHKQFPTISFTPEEFLAFLTKRLVAKKWITSRDDVYLSGGGGSHTVVSEHPYSDLDFSFFTTDLDFDYFKKTLFLIFIKRKIAQKMGVMTRKTLQINASIGQHAQEHLKCQTIDPKVLNMMILDMYLSGSFIYPGYTGCSLTLGKIDINLINKPSLNTVSTADSLYVGVNKDILRCRRGSVWGTQKELQESIEHLRERQMVILSKDIYKLSLCMIHKMTSGFTVLNFPFFQKHALEALFKEIPAEEIAFQLNKHVDKHYPESPQKKLLARINFLFLLSFASNETIRSSYTQAIVSPWVKLLNKAKMRSFARLISPLKTAPDLLPEVLSLIQGMFFLAANTNTRDFEKEQSAESRSYRFCVHSVQEQRFLAVPEKISTIAFNTLKAFITLSQKQAKSDLAQTITGAAKELELESVFLSTEKQESHLAEQLVTRLIHRISVTQEKEALISLLESLEKASVLPGIGKKLENIGIGQINRLLDAQKKVGDNYGPKESHAFPLLPSLMKVISFGRYKRKLFSVLNHLVKQNHAGNASEAIIKLTTLFFESSANVRDDEIRKEFLKVILSCLLMKPKPPAKLPLSEGSFQEAQRILETLNEEHSNNPNPPVPTLLIQQFFKQLVDFSDRKEILFLALQLAFRFDVVYAEKLLNIHQKEMYEHAKTMRETIKKTKPVREKRVVADEPIPKIESLIQILQEKQKAPALIRYAEELPKILEGHIKEKGAITPFQGPSVQRCLTLLIEKSLSSIESTPAGCSLLINPITTSFLLNSRCHSYLRVVLENYVKTSQEPPKELTAFCSKELLTLDASSKDSLHKLMISFMKVMPTISKTDLVIDPDNIIKIAKRFKYLNLEDQVRAVTLLLKYIEGNQHVRFLEVVLFLLGLIRKLPFSNFDEMHALYSLVIKYIRKLVQCRAIVEDYIDVSYQIINGLIDQINEITDNVPQKDQATLGKLFLLVEQTHREVLMSVKTGSAWEGVFSSIDLTLEYSELTFFGYFEKFLKMPQKEFAHGPLQTRLNDIFFHILFTKPRNLTLSKAQLLKLFENVVLLFKKCSAENFNGALLKNIFGFIATKGTEADKEWAEQSVSLNYDYLQRLREIKKSFVVEITRFLEKFNKSMDEMIEPFLAPIPLGWDYAQPFPTQIHELIGKFSYLLILYHEVAPQKGCTYLHHILTRILPRYPFSYQFFKHITYLASINGLYAHQNEITSSSAEEFEALVNKVSWSHLGQTPSESYFKRVTSFQEHSIDLMEMYQQLIEAGLISTHIPPLDDLFTHLNIQIILLHQVFSIKIGKNQQSLDDIFNKKNINLDHILVKNYKSCFELLQTYILSKDISNHSSDIRVELEFRFRAIREFRRTLRSLYAVASMDDQGYLFPNRIVDYLTQQFDSMLIGKSTYCVERLYDFYIKLPGVTPHQRTNLKTLKEKSYEGLVKNPERMLAMTKTLKLLIDNALKSDLYKELVNKKAHSSEEQEILRRAEEYHRIIDIHLKIDAELSHIYFHLDCLKKFLAKAAFFAVQVFDVKEKEVKEPCK